MRLGGHQVAGRRPEGCAESGRVTNDRYAAVVRRVQRLMRVGGPRIRGGAAGHQVAQRW